MADWSQGDDPHGVRKLLALLRSQQDPTRASPSQQVVAPTQQAQSISTSIVSAQEDVRYISFAQALPHLTRLSKDEAFLSALLKLKDEQDRYEEMLANERAIFSKGKASTASSNAAMTSWDKEALKRWDMLHQEQQNKLQSWRVPCFFETRDSAHLKSKSESLTSCTDCSSR